jgi:hypothetical protein
VTEETRRLGGELANTQIDEIANGWTAIRRRALGRDFPGLEALSEAEIARKLKPLFAKQAGVTRLAERYDAFFSVNAIVAARDAKKTPHQLKPHENDAEDLQLLLQLAQPAFVLTQDNGLISYVDDSGTFQAPWVRTIGELLTDPLPSGVPWGRSAKQQAKNFRRRPRKERSELERKLRESLRSAHTKDEG